MLIFKHFKYSLNCISSIDYVCITIWDGRCWMCKTCTIEYERGELSSCKFGRSFDHHAASIKKHDHYSKIGQKLTARMKNAWKVNFLFIYSISLFNDITIVSYLMFFCAAGLHKLYSWKLLRNHCRYFSLDILVLLHQNLASFSILSCDYRVNRD